jgi:hypothetical protein
MMSETGGKGGFLGGFLSNMFGGVQESADKTRVVNAIATQTGWDLTLEIGSQLAKQLGGTGEVRKILLCSGICC